MKTYRIYQVDSFTKDKFHGNPAGVVPNADGLTEDQMQRIARELNNSETAFIFESPTPEYDVEVRFFTPTTEVPICGHATIAAHYVRALEHKADSERVIQKTKAGILPVDIVKENRDYSIVMTQGAISVSDSLSTEITDQIADALGILVSDYRTDCPICIASTGHSKVMVAIHSTDLLHNLHPDMTHLASISKQINCNGFYVFTLNPNEDILVHGRMFAPAIGINEDPVTGNANGPLGAYLVKHNLFQDPTQDTFTFKIMQGESIRRDGTMQVTVTKTDTQPTLVQITGQAVVAFETTIEL